MRQIIVDTPEKNSNTHVNQNQRVEHKSQTIQPSELPQTGGTNFNYSIMLNGSLISLIILLGIKLFLKKRGDS